MSSLALWSKAVWSRVIAGEGDLNGVDEEAPEGYAEPLSGVVAEAEMDR
jgi:hypothetical protein